MLAEFRVRNYRNFRDELVLSFETEKNYEFNKNVIYDGIVRNSMVVGYNATGKTNLGRAILDISNSLTDNSVDSSEFSYYTNLYNEDNKAYFSYRFRFDEHALEYKYEKTGSGTVVREILLIDNRKVIVNDGAECFVKLIGAESLNLVNWYKNKNQIALVKYVSSNTSLDMNDETNFVFQRFMDFVRGMLMFSSTDRMVNLGFKNMQGNLFKKICELDHGVEELESFLADLDIHYSLIAKDYGMGNREVLFSPLLSSGTRALVFFFYWYMQRTDISFVYIDEFDAFYNSDLSTAVVQYLIHSTGLQSMLSTHNTDIISNELLRPDCYYQLADNKIAPLSKKTHKALREAHNLQKMYKAGAFNEEI